MFNEDLVEIASEILVKEAELEVLEEMYKEAAWLSGAKKAIRGKLSRGAGAAQRIYGGARSEMGRVMGNTGAARDAILSGERHIRRGTARQLRAGRTPVGGSERDLLRRLRERVLGG